MRTGSLAELLLAADSRVYVRYNGAVAAVVVE